nr:hypothetical protein [Nostoc sp. DedQUE02]
MERISSLFITLTDATMAIALKKASDRFLLGIGHWALATGDETDCDRTSAQPIAADGIRW